MRWRRVRRGLKWATVGAAGALAVLWVVTVFLGFYWRRGLWTVALENGAATIWRARAGAKGYVLTDSAKTYAVVRHDFVDYVPTVITSSPVFNCIARVPLWIPLVFAGGAAGMLRWAEGPESERRRRAGLCPSCGYDRGGLGAGGVCPECGAEGAAS